MKYLLLLLIMFLPCSIYAQSSHFKKKFSLKMSNAKIENVLEKMEELIEYHFSYEGDLFINEKRISINLQDKSLDQVLKILLGNKFDYVVLNNSIIVRRNKKYKYSPTTKKKSKPIKKQSYNSLENRRLLQVNTIQPLKKNCFKNLRFAIDTPDIENGIMQAIPQEVPRRKKAIKLAYTLSPLFKLHTHNIKSVGISTGLALDFAILKKFDIATSFSFTREKLQNDNFDISQLNNCNIDNLTESVARNYKSNLYMIDMSLQLRYKLFKKANIFFVTAGISNIYVNMNYDYYYNNEMVKYGTYYKLGLVTMMNLSCGLERKFSNTDKLSYQIEPFLKYSLATFSPEKVNLAYIGLTFRLNYYLRGD